MTASLAHFTPQIPSKEVPAPIEAAVEEVRPEAPAVVVVPVAEEVPSVEEAQ